LQPLPPFNNPTPEQAFLAKNYDENSKKSDRDPRGAFRNPQDGAAAGIVGPLGSSSFSLPNVERALSDMESMGGPVGGASGLGLPPSRLGPRGGTGPGAASGRPANLSPLGTSSPTGMRSPVSPSHTNAPSPGSVSAGGAGGQSQHEVLQHFFQSLLSTRDRTAAAAPTRNAASAGGQTNGAADTSITEDGS